MEFLLDTSKAEDKTGFWSILKWESRQEAVQGEVRCWRTC